MVRAIAELHGGTVSATSDGPGAGSEFTLRLPIVERQGVPLAAAHEGAAADL